MKKFLLGLAVLLASVGLLVWAAVIFIQGTEVPQGETKLRFKEVPASWAHVMEGELSLPFAAIAAIDLDGDGVDELFVGGGKEQADAVLKFTGQEFVELPASGLEKGSEDATMGASSMDVTGDGLVDLFVARESGVWFYENTAEKGTPLAAASFAGGQLSVPLADNTTPLSIAIGDINKDGWADLYVSGYIKNELVEGETIFNAEYGGYSHLFLNNGDNSWKDISVSAGIWRQHNTFTAVFVDLDDDLDGDLVIAQDTGKVEMYANNGDLTFSPIKNPSVYSYPMGIGVGDIDNDGRLDFYFSNVGNTLPRALVAGDLREDQAFNMDYMLFRNEGELVFSDIAAKAEAAKHGFGWGTVIQDMDLDGRADLLAAQNYGRFPGVDYLELYEGRLLKQYEGGVYKPVEKKAAAGNPFFGLTPVVSDFDGNGWPDIAWLNLNGPLRVLLNEGVPGHGWLKVRLEDNPFSVGAIVTVKMDDGTKLTDQFIVGEGLSSDQTPELMFGLGVSQKVTSVTVRYQDGTVKTVENPEANQLLEFVK